MVSFSKETSYTDTKSKIGLDRLYQMKSKWKFGIKSPRDLWESLKLKFLPQTLTTDNNLRNILQKQMIDDEKESEIIKIGICPKLTDVNNLHCCIDCLK